MPQGQKTKYFLLMKNIEGNVYEHSLFVSSLYCMAPSFIYANLGNSVFMTKISRYHRKKKSLEELIDEIPVRCMSYTFDRGIANKVCYWSANYVNNEKSPSANREEYISQNLVILYIYFHTKQSSPKSITARVL